MKKCLFFFAFIFLGGIFEQAKSQCYLQKFDNAVVQLVSSTILGPNKCELELNISFNMEYNDGAKDLYITSYLDEDYTNLAISDPLDFDCGNPATPAKDMPTNTRLGTDVDEIGKSFLDIGFDLDPTRPNFGDPPVPVTLLTTYTPDASVVLFQNTVPGPGYTPGLLVTRENIGGNVGHFVITGLKVIINKDCSATIAVRTDVFASNASGATKAHCYDCGSPQFFNDPQVSGFKNCDNPRRYAIGISTVDPTVRDIIYKVYLDANENNTLESGGPDILAFTSGTIQISEPGGPGPDSYSSGLVALPSPYSDSQPYSEYNYFILVEGTTLSNSIAKLLPNPGCIGLPVNIVSFTASRNHSNVLLNWETNWEQNSRGFAIERNNDGTWKEAGFVTSQAQGGNSSDLLSYQFIDFNNSKGITQYRIRQVDFDNRSKYSEIRSVRGESQIGKIIIYPNPTMDGRVNVSFEDATQIRDVSLIDMSGRIVNQWNAVTNNQITIENLTPGMYTLRVIVPESGEQIVEKIVVNKR